MTQPLDPNAVNRIITDPDSELYPAAIGVFCDRCHTAEVGDFVVSDQDTQQERFEIARAHLRKQGWSCVEAGDLCPTCLAADSWTVTPENVYSLWDHDIVQHCKPHFGASETTGRVEIDGLTIWALSSATGERVWARFGDTITRGADGFWTVTRPTAAPVSPFA